MKNRWYLLISKKDKRSLIVDALSTMMIDKHMAKIVALHDNEWAILIEY